MTVTRIYQAVPLNEDATLTLDEKASHYVTTVLRARVGDSLILFNGKGGEYPATITHIRKKQVDVTLNHFHAREVESPIKLYLAQGMARGEKMDFIVQKAVELGVNKIIPLYTERCNVKLNQEREDKRLQHWQAVTISACEQSGRNRVPEVSAPITLEAWLPTVKADQCFILSPHTKEKLALETLPPEATVILLVGPEGGFTDEEVALAIKYHFSPLNLGPRILRTETAGLAALATLQYRYGDFKE